MSDLRKLKVGWDVFRDEATDDLAAIKALGVDWERGRFPAYLEMVCQVAAKPEATRTVPVGGDLWTACVELLMLSYSRDVWSGGGKVLVNKLVTITKARDYLNEDGRNHLLELVAAQVLVSSGFGAAALTINEADLILTLPSGERIAIECKRPDTSNVKAAFKALRDQVSAHGDPEAAAQERWIRSNRKGQKHAKPPVGEKFEYAGVVLGMDRALPLATTTPRGQPKDVLAKCRQIEDRFYRTDVVRRVRRLPLPVPLVMVMLGGISYLSEVGAPCFLLSPAIHWRLDANLALPSGVDTSSSAIGWPK